MKVYILIPWFQPAYKAGGPIQSVANMVNGLNGISVVDHEILPSAERKVNRFAQHSVSGSGQDDSLRRDNYEFKIFCSNKDLDGTILKGVAFDEWVRYNAHTKVWYSSSGNILPVLQQEIKKEKPDHLFITGIYDWQFNVKPLLFCRGVKKIISVRGMLHPGALSQKGFKKKIYLQLWKLLGLHKANVFHATDEAEKKYIQQVFKNDLNIQVAANFPNVLAVQPVVQKEPGQLKLVSVALISAMKNVLLVLEALGSRQLGTGGSFGDEILPIAESEVDRFAQQTAVRLHQDDKLRGEGVGSEGHSFGDDEILPSAEASVNRFAQEVESGSGQDDKLRREGGGSGEVSIEYNIYGPIKDKQYWEACEAQIKKLPPNITVNYHGDIAPDKIAGALAANHVFILPSKSENFGHAIYEALSAGRPVITSNNTPWNKLEAAKAGMNVSLNNTTELVHTIERFAGMKPEELEAWSKGARIYAERAVDVDAIRKQYIEMFS